MLSTTLTLWLEGSSDLQLSRTEFLHPLIEQPFSTYRGRTSIMGEGTFVWSAAVKALCILLLRAVLDEKRKAQLNSISGGRGSLAASLDYAISKKPFWLLDMFGMDQTGRPLIQRILLRRNSERKRSGPVEIFLNHKFLHPSCIRVMLDGNETLLIPEIERAVGLLEGQFRRPPRRAPGRHLEELDLN